MCFELVSHFLNYLYPFGSTWFLASSVVGCSDHAVSFVGGVKAQSFQRSQRRHDFLSIQFDSDVDNNWGVCIDD